MVRFDTDLATIPLGDNGTFATYFVHPENVVELQMLLLLHTRFFLTRSRSNSIATPVTSESQTMGLASSQPDLADFHMLAADDLDRFAQEQGSLTVDDREHCPGSSPQRAKAAVRWNSTEDALACVRASSRHIKSASLKRKYVHDFFDRDADFRPKQQLASADKAESVEHVRRELLKENARPLFHYAGCRSRLTGLDDDAEGIVLAALDTGVTIENASKDKRPDDRTTFPFALLFVRQEGRPKSDLFGVLNSSYLVSHPRPCYDPVTRTDQRTGRARSRLLSGVSCSLADTPIGQHPCPLLAAYPLSRYTKAATARLETPESRRKRHRNKIRWLEWFYRRDH